MSPECERCGETYTVRHGCEPTKYCDECAHILVDELQHELGQLKQPMNPPPIQTASVKVMRSHDYCHFEVCLSANALEGTFKIPVSLDAVDELRKQAARLADKAVEQYKIAKENLSRMESDDCRKQAMLQRAEQIEEMPEPF